MTAPTRRPSVEGALGNHEKRIGTLESIAPPVAAAQTLFPTNVPRMPVVPNSTGHRRWPGGVVIVNAYSYVTNGTTANNTNQNSFWYDGTNFKIVKHTQALDTSADGVSTISFNVGDVGLIPKVLYDAVICWRYPAAGAGFLARAYVSKTYAASGWVLLGSAGTNVAATYFGMMKGGPVGWGSSADTVDVKIGYKTSGGSGEVQMDYIVFIPSADAIVPADLPTPQPKPVANTGMPGGGYRSMPGTNGPTAAFVATDVHAPFGGDSYTDTQSCYDVLDSTNFNFTFGSIGLQSAYYYARMEGRYPADTTYPQHLYLPCRLRPLASTSPDNDGLWDSQSFVTVLENGVPTDTSPIITCSWQLVYLGCHYLDNPNSLAIAVWTPPEEATNARSPFEFSDPASFDDPLVDKSIYGATSFLDQIDWTE